MFKYVLSSYSYKSVWTDVLQFSPWRFASVWGCEDVLEKVRDWILTPAEWNHTVPRLLVRVFNSSTAVGWLFVRDGWLIGGGWRMQVLNQRLAPRNDLLPTDALLWWSRCCQSIYQISLRCLSLHLMWVLLHLKLFFNFLKLLYNEANCTTKDIQNIWALTIRWLELCMCASVSLTGVTLKVPWGEWT